MSEPKFENSSDKEIEINPALLTEGVKIIEKYFDNKNTGRERIDAILDRIEPILKSEFIDNGQIKASLEACVGIDDKNDFIDRVLDALKPIFYFRMEHPKDFERLVEEASNVPLNEILYYGEDMDIIHIHLKSIADLLKKYGRKDGMEKVEELLEDGLNKLANILEKNNDIKKITATSWLCASKSGKKRLEQLGFVYDGLISEEFRSLHFQDAVNAKGEPEDVAIMHMDRDDFLAKYGKK